MDTTVKEDIFYYKPVASLKLTQRLWYKQPRISKDFDGNELLFILFDYWFKKTISSAVLFALC